MMITRRAFTGGALSLTLGAGVPARAVGQSFRADLAEALASIRAFGDAMRAYYGLPGLTLGLTTPDGFSTVMNFGYANADARTPITSDTLFQIGSISKCMNAAVLHQFAAEGRLSLSDRVSSLLPAIPLPAGNEITVQHLLDHVAGLPDSAPMFGDSGLWTAYPPGAHWHYSNTGYAILGVLAEHIGQKPLSHLLAQRLFTPLGMTRTHGAIIGADRTLYAQGYEASDQTIPFAVGAPLSPAAWVDVTDAAGSIASTAEDMTRFLRALADAAQGRGGLGLGPQQGRAFTSHFVPSDNADMSYGNGLMRVGNAGRTYLHHTGGMLSFSSAFHVDLASGVGAFASATLSGLADFRPRLLSRFAVDVLTNALARKPPPATPALGTKLPAAAAYVGHYSGPGGKFEVRAGDPLTIVADGASAALQPWGGEIFRTTHPTLRKFSLMFGRTNGFVSGASWGGLSYVKEGGGGTIAPGNAAIAMLAGRYINDSPWVGAAIVVERGGKLWIGTETPMTKIGENLWRVGNESWSPERASFANFIDGRPQTLLFSGERFIRHDI